MANFLDRRGSEGEPRTRVATTNLGLATAVAAGVWLFSGATLAQNAVFQNFFTAVCAGAPAGNLAVLCGLTGGGAGDGNISGDS